MAKRYTSPVYTGSLWRETYYGSRIFESYPFYPTIFSFDVDIDTLKIKDVKLESKGTPLSSHFTTPTKRYEFVATSTSSDRFIFGENRNNAVYPMVFALVKNDMFYFNNVADARYWRVFKTMSRLGKYSIVNCYFGCGYSVEIEKYIIFTFIEYGNDINSLTSTDIERSEVSANSIMGSYIRDNFFGGSSPTNLYRIERILPLQPVFTQGESSKLEYALTNSAGERILTEPSELSVYPGTGWGYNEETKTITYISGNWSTNVTVKFVYDGEEYQKNDTFYPEGSNIYNPGGNSGAIGGGGSFGIGESSDNIFDDLPSGSVEVDTSATGMYTRYLMNPSLLRAVGEWLWTDDLGLSVAKTFISLLYGDPAESIISLMSFPFNLSSMQGLQTANQNLYWGNHDSGISLTAIRSSAVTVDWGTITLSEYWGNFLDYSPHTKIDLYLPWGTGFVSIDPGQCLPGTLRVVTNIELSKGSCIHNVIGNDGVIIGSFAGQCSKQLPLFSSDTASKIAGLVTAGAAGIAVGAAGAAGIASGAAYGRKLAAAMPNGTKYVSRDGLVLDAIADQVASNVADTGRVAGKIATTSLAINRAPTHVTRNGGFTDGSASLGIQFPYIILSRPTQSVPNEYGHHYGYPSNIYASLGSLKGYTEIGEIHLDSVPGSADELSELDRILKEGVIF